MPTEIQATPSTSTSSSTTAAPAAANIGYSELRHITSNPGLAPQMKERHASTSTDKSGRTTHPHVSVSPPPHRMGSRSPSSIPSSPTSVHSSSSAIFERDIEPALTSPSHPLNQPHPHPSNPHRTPRSKTSEPLDQAVPTVLDSAIELLAAPADQEDSQHIAVESPVPSASRVVSAIGSPIGRGSQSRSPSPTMSAGTGGGRTSMLLNLPSPLLSTTLPLATMGGSPTRPLPPPLAPAPLPRSGTPTSMSSATYESAVSSPTTTTLEHPPHALPVPPPHSPSQQQQSLSHPPSPHAATHRLSYPPSPSQKATKRLSFISYTDMLASTPTSTLPLSLLTAPISSDPPPHLPAVALSFPPAPGSSVGSAAASVLDGVPGAYPRTSLLDDGGGEWEREGHGRGLEERLEALMTVGPGRA